MTTDLLSQQIDKKEWVTSGRGVQGNVQPVGRVYSPYDDNELLSYIPTNVFKLFVILSDHALNRTSGWDEAVGMQARFLPKVDYSGNAACLSYLIFSDWTAVEVDSMRGAKNTLKDYSAISVYAAQQFGEPLAKPRTPITVAKPKKALEPYVKALNELQELTGQPKDVIAKFIGVSRQTTNAWERGDSSPSSSNEIKLYAVRSILRRAAKRFSTQREMAAWLKTEVDPSGITPINLLVNGELDKLRFLAISTPSEGVLAPPEWINKPLPARYQGTIERRRLPVPAEDPSESDTRLDAESDSRL